MMIHFNLLSFLSDLDNTTAASDSPTPGSLPRMEGGALPPAATSFGLIV